MNSLKRPLPKATVTEPRKGKRVALLTVKKKQVYVEKTYFFTKVIQVTERTVNKHGQLLLVPDITVEGWWTNLAPQKREDHFSLSESRPK